jgi:hypothetical protein
MDAVIAVVVAVILAVVIVKVSRVLWVVAEGIIRLAKSVAIIGAASLVVGIAVSLAR